MYAMLYLAFCVSMKSTRKKMFAENGLPEWWELCITDYITFICIISLLRTPGLGPTWGLHQMAHPNPWRLSTERTKPTEHGYVLATASGAESGRAAGSRGHRGLGEGPECRSLSKGHISRPC